jgi:hypothetical protein
MMDLQRALVASAIMTLAGVLAAGCGVNCEDLCEDQKACSDVPADSDCTLYCEDARALAQIAECDEAYDDYLDCATDLEDVCSSEHEECDDEERTYSSCIVEFCSENPDDPACLTTSG